MKNSLALFAICIFVSAICQAGIDGPVFELKTMGMDVSLDEISTWIGPVVIDEYTFEFYDKINPNIMVRCQIYDWDAASHEIREKLKMTERDYYCDYIMIQKYTGPIGGFATIYAVYDSEYMQNEISMFFTKISGRNVEMQWAYHTNIIPGKIEPPAPPVDINEWECRTAEENRATIIFQVKKFPPLP